MSQEAIVILMDWATQNSIKQQENFSDWLSKQMEYYQEKQMTITGRIMERLIENYEETNVKV